MMILGHSHPDDGGMGGQLRSNPFLRLSENSRPGWILNVGDFFRVQDVAPPTPARREYVLIPTVDHTLEDGLMLMALVLYHDKPWGDAATHLKATLLEEGRLELHDFDEQLREDTRKEVRERADTFPKMALSIFENHSLIHGQIGALRHYAHEMSVCLPVFTRNHSRWSNRPNESGTLPELDSSE